MTENHFRSHFSPFQDNTQIFIIVLQNHPRRPFWMTKFSFDRISHHFRSIRNFYFFHKMAAVNHFGWSKITFKHISRHFRSIRNFFVFEFFLQNGLWRPYWMTGNHFLSHFSPFQINTPLIFFSQFFIFFVIILDYKKLRIVLKWREMASKVIFGYAKWLPADNLWKISKLNSTLSCIVPA